MSKIIKKRDLDLVIESTLKEVGLFEDVEHTCEVCGETPCNCDDESEEDVVDSSVKDLAESVSKTLNMDYIKDDMESFNKLINYRK